jgi:hypothetical protein
MAGNEEKRIIYTGDEHGYIKAYDLSLVIKNIGLHTDVSKNTKTVLLRADCNLLFNFLMF